MSKRRGINSNQGRRSQRRRRYIPPMLSWGGSAHHAYRRWAGNPGGRAGFTAKNPSKSRKHRGNR